MATITNSYAASQFDWDGYQKLINRHKFNFEEVNEMIAETTNQQTDDDIVVPMIEVKIEENTFRKVKETLTRIGVANSQNQLFQTCHILALNDKYYITHFKELFGIDGREVNMNYTDLMRRNSIIDALQRWKLVDVVNKEDLAITPASRVRFTVIPFKDKESWELIPKYRFSNRFFKENVEEFEEDMQYA